MEKIILASSSKRRIEMMKNKNYEPLIMPADVDEALPLSMTPEASVMYLALKKAMFTEHGILTAIHAANELHMTDKIHTADKTIDDDYIILAADTVVVYDSCIIGKPKDKKEAFEILSTLRNNCHHVLTGVCIIDSSKNIKTCFCDDTLVYFKNYTDDELAAYVDTPEPYDKAGGYAIQETFKKYVDHIEGDFDNVVGFPWYRIEPYLSM